MIIKDLAGFSEPATKLIELVGNAVGTVFQPTRIRREARAQADALLIKTGAEIEAAELKVRAANRFVAQELQKQANIESVLLGASGDVSNSPAGGQEMDSDWLSRFVLEAQEVSDARLQQLWSKLLAGEFQVPGRYSRRVFRVLKELDPKEVAIIDETAARALTVTFQDEQQAVFLNVDIYEEWVLGAERNRSILGTTKIENVTLLQELGLIDDYQFGFSVEGPMQPDQVHLSRGSARSMSLGTESITAAFVQPAFIGKKGFGASTDGRPMIDDWLKQVIFDSWRATSLGEQVFSLSRRAKSLEHWNEVNAILSKSGIVLE